MSEQQDDGKKRADAEAILSRRRFLIGTTLAGAGLGAAAVGCDPGWYSPGPPPPKPKDPPPPPPPPPKDPPKFKVPEKIKLPEKVKLPEKIKEPIPKVCLTPLPPKI